MSQSKFHSLFESINGALFAAPTAILLHKAVLMIAGENAINTNQDLFVTLSWVLFFTHSVAWKFIIRRVHEHFGVKLDPLNIGRTAWAKLH
jgi:hypothetical protein